MTAITCCSLRFMVGPGECDVGFQSSSRSMGRDNLGAFAVVNAATTWELGDDLL